MSGTAAPTGSGRRTRAGAARRLSPTVLLAVLLPLLTVGALALVRPEPPAAVDRPSRAVPVEQADLVCPAGLGADPELAVGPAGELAEGTAGVDGGDRDTTDVELDSDTVTSLDDREDPTFVRARGAVAAQLLASRFETRGLAATECPLPRPTYYFTGAGADADHASVLELANPDTGPAVADVTVLGRRGPIDVPRLRGLTVQGGQTLEVDLARAVPTRSELALEVVVSRGRLGATVRDEIPALGARTATRDWLPAGGEPATEQLLLGVAEGAGRDTLTLANHGEDEVRAEVRVVTTDASFVPEGLEEVPVAPGAVASVPLAREVRDQIADGAVGVAVSSTGPVTAGLSSVVDSDLSHAPAVDRVGAPMTALVPPGEARLVLAGAGGTGAATIRAYGGGRLLDERRIELTEGSGGTLDLPGDTSLVEVTPRRTSVAASVVSTGTGATVVPLRELVRTALVPDVRPGLP